MSNDCARPVALFSHTRQGSPRSLGNPRPTDGSKSRRPGRAGSHSCKEHARCRCCQHSLSWPGLVLRLAQRHPVPGVQYRSALREKTRCGRHGCVAGLSNLDRQLVRWARYRRAPLGTRNRSTLRSTDSGSGKRAVLYVVVVELRAHPRRAPTVPSVELADPTRGRGPLQQLLRRVHGRCRSGHAEARS